ncbi:MAG: Maf family nucleotide pyrophosphatase [Burkholderiales bacterium]
MSNTTPARIVLASSSRYRRDLLGRLGLAFEVRSPNVDETAHELEGPQALALRLACAKARAIRADWPDALIIGSDQVAVCGDVILDKPGNFTNALAQLQLMRGKASVFHTALCVLNSRTQREQTAVVPVTVHMRKYADAQLERYLRADEPYDCAGSARIEGLGIALVEKIEGNDPSALIGLPLIALCEMLRNEGLDLP